MLTFYIALGFFDGVSVPFRTYPLAGITQSYPRTGSDTYPLAGISQAYPLVAS